jgi:hypothetical protein
MESKKEDWFLVLDNRSMLAKNWGAYKLDTIMNFKEMNILPRCTKY